MRILIAIPRPLQVPASDAPPHREPDGDRQSIPATPSVISPLTMRPILKEKVSGKYSSCCSYEGSKEGVKESVRRSVALDGGQEFL